MTIPSSNMSGVVVDDAVSTSAVSAMTASLRARLGALLELY